MTGRRRIEERISRKEQEIQELEMQLREARAYVQALQDVIKLLPRDPSSPPAGESVLRQGSTVAEARAAILRVGKPLHITEILAEIGREVTRETRSAVSGSLSAYVRRGEIFTRPQPNTFGLVDLGPAEHEVAASVPPDDFGLDDQESDDVPF